MQDGFKSPLVFSPSEPLTLGVEVEIQLLDKETFDLKAASPKILSRMKSAEERVKAELFQSMIEINTGICRNAHEVSEDLGGTMDAMREHCEKLGLRMASAGTHPFAHYSGKAIFPAQRYVELIDRNQWIARRLMIFGLHVHVGMRSGEHAIRMNNALLHHLPMLLALSASSPYWKGEDTELASSRITFFEALPTGGHPCRIDSWRDFEDVYARLARSGAVTSVKDIWWDIRPSPGYGTLEIRICDGLPTLAETVALTSLIHMLCTYIDEQIMRGREFRAPPDWILRENKWRASRHGLEAKLIINEEGETAHMRPLIQMLFEDLAPLIEKHGYEPQISVLKGVMDKGASYLRQRLQASRVGGDLKEVTRFLADEFDRAAPIWDPFSGASVVELPKKARGL